MGNLKIGTAGVPHSAKKPDTIEGIKRVKELGLDAMEIEFVRGVKMTRNLAEKVRETARKLGVSLTVHAPYYVNLASEEEEKCTASIKRVVDSAIIGDLCGAESVTFHPGYYGKNPEVAREKIKRGILEIMKQLKGCYITLSPETTGKPSQFGSLEELLEMAKEMKISLCVDFAHLYARSLGEINDRKGFKGILKNIKNALGDKSLKSMHIHISGMEYSNKGEVKHLNFKESNFNYTGLVESLIEEEVEGILIVESPNLEEDALLFRDIYMKYSGKKI